jgi:FkbM family methyltransferase
LSFVTPDDFRFNDEHEVRERHWHPKVGDVVVDVGAGIGSYALPAMAAGAHVIAYSPEESEGLLRVIYANQHVSGTISLIKHGLSSKPGHITCDGHAYYFHDARGPEEKLPGFDVTTLDAENHPRVDWIKIDVEGQELEVLRGAAETIKKFKPKILVENHVFMIADIDRQVEGFIASLDLGYRIETHPWHSVSHSFFEVK